jgi:glycosyltransferase involved in cell wall biosynthesis
MSRSNGIIVWVANGSESFGTRQMIVSLARGLEGAGYTPLLMSTGRGALESQWRQYGWRLAHTSERADDLPVAAGSVFNRLGAVRQWQRHERDVVATLRDSRRHIFATQFVKAVIGLRPYHLAAVQFLARQTNAVPIWEMPNSLSAKRFALSRYYYWLRLAGSDMRLVPLSRYALGTLGPLRRRATQIYPAAETGRFDPELVQGLSRGQLGLPSDVELTVGLFARVNPVKGQGVMLDAVERLAREGIRVAVLMVGAHSGEPYSIELRQLVQDRKMEGSVVVVDAAPDVEKYYSAIDVAVNWRLDAEPFGISVVEAMLMEKPVLAHRLGGPSESVIDGQTGWLAGDPSVATLCDSLLCVIQDRPDWERRGQLGRQRALKLFNQEERTNRYRRLIEGGPH